MLAREAQEHRHEIDRAVETDAEGEGKPATDREVAVEQRPQIDDRLLPPQAAADEGEACQQRDREQAQHVDRCPTVLGRILQADLQRRQRQRHQQQPGPVDGAGVTVFARLARQEAARYQGSGNARPDIHQEQPVPGIGLGDPAAHQGTNRRRQHRHHAGQRRGDALLAEGKQQEDGGEHRRDQHAAREALHHAADDQGFEAAACRAAGRGQGEQRERGDEQPAQAEHARQKPGQGNGDHFGDQIGGLHPAHLVGGDGERRADIGQRGDDDLDVEHGHEHAERHGREADPGARANTAVIGHRGHPLSAASSARMRTQSASALNTENAKPYQTSPKTSGSTRISAATMQ